MEGEEAFLFLSEEGRDVFLLCVEVSTLRQSDCWTLKLFVYSNANLR